LAGRGRKAIDVSKFTDAQRAFVILKGYDVTQVEEICGTAGISQATYFSWKKKYAGLMGSARVVASDQPQW